MVNFGEVRRAQLAKSTLLITTLAPLWSFQMLKRESGVWKATGNYRTYSMPGKTATLVPVLLRWKTCLRKNCSLGSCACSGGPVLGQNTLVMMILGLISSRMSFVFITITPRHFNFPTFSLLEQLNRNFVRPIFSRSRIHSTNVINEYGNLKI